jgi:Ca2+/Na+ antiporter
MNELDRDKFYGPGGDEWGDDGQDYELEPVDADVLAAEERRARELVEETSLAIDVDEVYRARERRLDQDFPHKLSDGFRFRFQIKHLLVLMAVVAVAMTLVRLEVVGGVLVVLLLAAVVVMFGYMELKEHRKWVEAERIWKEKLERRREFLERRLQRPTRDAGAPPTIYDDLPLAGAPVSETPIGIRRVGQNSAEAARRPGEAGNRFRFQFSLRQLLIAMTFASVIMGITYLLGGPENMATLLGIVILIGLAAHAWGAQLPEIVVLGWWWMLALYVFLSLIAVVLSSFQ